MYLWLIITKKSQYIAQCAIIEGTEKYIESFRKKNLTYYTVNLFNFANMLQVAVRFIRRSDGTTLTIEKNDTDTTQYY